MDHGRVKMCAANILTPAVVPKLLVRAEEKAA